MGGRGVQAVCGARAGREVPPLSEHGVQLPAQPARGEEAVGPLWDLPAPAGWVMSSG